MHIQARKETKLNTDNYDLNDLIRLSLLNTTDIEIFGDTF
jgi:hypothetical protein